MVTDVSFWRSIKINITVNTAHVPHILSFKIRTITKAEYLYGNIISTRANDIGKVELCICIRSFSITYVLSVYPNMSRTVNTIEVKHYSLAVPTFGQVKIATIRTHGIMESTLHLDKGRLVMERVVYIDIVGLAIAFHFQARRYTDGIPLRNICMIDSKLFFSRTA